MICPDSYRLISIGQFLAKGKGNSLRNNISRYNYFPIWIQALIPFMVESVSYECAFRRLKMKFRLMTIPKVGKT